MLSSSNISVTQNYPPGWVNKMLPTKDHRVKRIFVWETYPWVLYIISYIFWQGRGSFLLFSQLATSRSLKSSQQTHFCAFISLQWSFEIIFIAFINSVCSKISPQTRRCLFPSQWSNFRSHLSASPLGKWKTSKKGNRFPFFIIIILLMGLWRKIFIFFRGLKSDWETWKKEVFDLRKL